MTPHVKLIPILARQVDSALLKGNKTWGRRLSSTLKNFAQRLDDEFGLPETPSERMARLRSNMPLNVSPMGLELLKAMVNDPRASQFDYVEEQYWPKYKEVTERAVFNIVRHVKKAFDADQDSVLVTLNNKVIEVKRSDESLMEYSK